MKTAKTKFIALLLIIALCALCMSALVACDDKDAQSETTEISVKLDYGDGSSLVDKTLKPSDIATLTPPTRVGYDFVGWTLDKDGTQNLPQNLTSGVMLYAQWKIKTYSISFMLDAVTLVEKKTLEYGATITPPSMEKVTALLAQDQSFLGWKDFSNTDVATQNRVIYADIQTIVDTTTYTVKFQNGNDVIKSIEGKAGDEIIPPAKTENPQKSGYTFSHWATQTGKQFEDGAKIVANEIYNAVYTINAPATPDVSKGVNITYGDNATLNASIATNYSGITYSYAWYIDSTKIGDGASIDVANLVAGTHAIRCEAVASDGTQTSSASSTIATINVQKATLTATFDNINLVYGDNLPKITISYNGFKYDDDKSVVDESALSFSTTYTSASNVGTYTVSANNLNADNYIIVGKNGAEIAANVYVAKKEIASKDSVLWASKTYDGNVFSKQYTNADFNGVLGEHTLTLDIATKSQNAGEYAFDVLQKTLSIVDGNGVDVSANYIVTYSAKMTINNANIVYTSPQNVALAYNGKAQSALASELKDEIGVSYAKEENGTYATSAPTFKNAGDYTVYFKIERANYNSVQGSYSVSVAKAKITISPKTNQPYAYYGDESFALAQGIDYYEIVGDVYDTLDITLSTNYTVGNNKGTYDVQATLNEDANGNYNNYDATCTVAKNALEIVQATLTITLSDLSTTYLDNIGNLFATSESGTYVHFAVSGLYKNDDIKDVVAFEISKANIALWDSSQAYDATVFGVGEYTLRATGTTNDNYHVASTSATFSVAKRTATLSIDNKQITYGDSAPAYTFTSADEYARALELNYVCNFSGAGNYDITATLKANDYAQNFDVTSIEKGTLTVNKRAITIKANDASTVYGNYFASANCTYTLTQGSIVDGDTITATFATDYTMHSAQWSFDIEITAVDIASAKNYDVTFKKGTLTVTKRTIEVTYNNQNVAYTGEPHVFEPIFTHGDLAENDNVSSENTFSIKTKSGEIGFYANVENDIGDFEIVKAMIITKDGVDVTEFYDFTFRLAVEIKQIEIEHTITDTTHKYDGTAHSATITAEDGATLTYTYNGASTTAIPAFINAGEYEIAYTIEKDGKSPYSNSFTITINKRQTTINVTSLTVEYGDDFPADYVPYIESGDSILSGDNKALNVQFSTVAGIGTPVGVYPFTFAYDESPNYAITVNNGALTIVPKKVEIHEKDGYTYMVTYGTQAMPFTNIVVYDYGNAGKVLDDAQAYISVLPVRADGYKYELSNDTVATVLPDDKGNVNYEVVLNEIIAHGIAKEVTIKVNDLTIDYGKMPVYTYTVLSGTVLDEDYLALNYTPSANSIPSAGNYNISATPQRNYPYAITVQECGVLTVNKLTLTATLSGKDTITYGEDFPSYTVSKYDGFAFANEYASLVSGTLNVTSDYCTQKKAGTFSLTASGLSADNYIVVFAPFALTVKKAPLTVSANPHDAITYGDDLPSDFTYTATGFVNGDTIALLDGKVSFTSNYAKGDDASTYTYNVANNITLDNYVVTIGDAQTLVVNKANYTAQHVQEALNSLNLSGTYSHTQTLGAFSLAGTPFTWTDASIVPTCDNTLGYSATYCADATNYNPYSTMVTINLAKAHYDLIIDGSDFGADWTGSAINYASIISVKSDNNTDASKGDYVITITKPSSLTQIVDGGIYTIHYYLAPTSNYLAGECDVTFKVYTVDYNGTHYTVEDAFEKVASGTITLFGNAFLSKDVTLNSGITFILPCDDGYSTTAGKVTVADDYVGTRSGEHAYKTQSAKFTLTIPQNVTMNVNGGNVIIAGRLGTTGGGMEGHTSGSYSKINNNGNIVLNGGIFDVRGYVTTDGTGKAIFNSGNVYSPFVVRDFKGGSYTINKAWGLTGLFKNRVAPFSEYEMRNIQCQSIYYSGATLGGYADLYASSAHNITTADIISSKGLLQIGSGGYIVQTFNTATEKSTLTLVGNITLGSLSLTVKVSGISSTVKMSETFLPIPWTYDINVGDGTTATTLNLQYDYKAMPGCTITIKSNATVNATKGNIAIYSNFTDTNTVDDGAYKYPISKGTAAKLVMDGGTLNAYKFGGIIYATSNGGTVKVSNAVSVTAYEHNGDKEWSVSETARFEDGTTLSKGTTYTYNGTAWA